MSGSTLVSNDFNVQDNAGNIYYTQRTSFAKNQEPPLTNRLNSHDET